MAKGVEDTAFYRYARLLALNDVGGDPGRFSISRRRIPCGERERARFPLNLLVTQTHDTKRSGDVRARIGALASMPDAFARNVRNWLAVCRSLTSGGAPDPVEQLFIFQTLLGAWPISAERLEAYLEKALREAKVHTTWVEPDEAHEAAVKRSRAALYTPPRLPAHVRAVPARGRRGRRPAGARPAAAQADRPGRPGHLPGRRAAEPGAGRPRQPAAGRLGASAARRSPTRRRSCA